MQLAPDSRILSNDSCGYQTSLRFIRRQAFPPVCCEVAFKCSLPREFQQCYDARRMLEQGLRKCTHGLVIEAVSIPASLLFIDPQGEAFPLIGENTWAVGTSRQEWLSCLDEVIVIIPFHQSNILKYGHLRQIVY